jgi:hypothetical protein
MRLALGAVEFRGGYYGGAGGSDLYGFSWRAWEKHWSLACMIIYRE